MLLILPLILKVLLFMNLSKIENNRLLVFTVSLLTILFIYTLINLSPRKWKHILGLVVYILISSIMFLDVMYFSYFNRLLSVILIKMVGVLGSIGDSIRDLLTIKRLLFLLDIPFIAIYSLRRKESKIKVSPYIRWGAPPSVLLVLAILLFYLSKAQLFGPITNQEFFTYHAKDIKKAISKEDTWQYLDVFTQEDFEELKERTRLKEGKYTGIGQGRNLIVIQIEALQNFVMNLVYNGQEITPNMNKLIASEGTLYFDNYHQLISKGNTSDAEFVSNNSLHPSYEDPSYTQYQTNTFYGLPWILRDYGYNAWVFHGYEKEFWNREKAYPNQGFQRFISEEDYDVVEAMGFGITDEEFYKQSMEYIKDLDGIDDNPFYAFIISLSSHTPFNIPEKYRYLDLKEEHEGTFLGDYLQSVYYADKALGDFFSYLKEEGIYEDSVIALYGDHFALSAFNEDQKNLMTEFLGRPYYIDEMFKIPLLISVPGEEVRETISKIGSQLDFLPTILNIMGYDNKKGLMMGVDLVNFQGYNYVAPQYYVQRGSFIDEENILSMSNDRLFENSKAMDKDTKIEIDRDPLKERHLQIIAQIKKSDYILKADLIKHMQEDQDQIDFNQLIYTNN